MRTRGPLGFMAAGLGLVAVDFRTEALDLLPDPLGWTLVAVGAFALRLRWAAWGSVVAALLSVPDTYLEYHYRLIDPRSLKPVDRCPLEELAPGELCSERVVFDPVTGWRLAALAAAVTLGVAAVGVLLTGLRRRAKRDADPTAAGRLSQLRAAV